MKAGRFLALIGLAVLMASPGVAALAQEESAPSGESSSAQPRYVSSDPSSGEMRHEAPDRVSITFSEPLDGSSEITVHDRCGRRIDDAATRVDLNEMSVGIVRKPSGVYRVAYKATGIGGVTGTTTGSFRFSVHLGPSCDGRGGHGHHGNGNGHHGGQGGHGGGSSNEHGNGHANGGTTHTGEHSTTHPGTHSQDRHAAHDDGRHETRHGRHRGQTAEDPAEERIEEAPLAAGDLEPVADARAVLVGLGLAMAFGVIGGWFLRVAPS